MTFSNKDQFKRPVIVLGALPASLYNFRGELVRTISKDNKVVCMASFAEKSERAIIESLGASFIDYPIKRNSLSVGSDLHTLYSLIKAFRLNSPKLVLAYTIKPVIWGGIAARFTNVSSFYAMITGLGYAFQEKGIVKRALTALVKQLYRFALGNVKAVMFQNKDDMSMFIAQGIVNKNKCFLVNGSGVDLKYYAKKPIPQGTSFLLVARLLGDKGIREYTKAAAVVKKRYPDSQFHLVGPEDSSPDAINIEEVQSWQRAGWIQYHGSTSDVRPFLERCSVFVLPSYHEGMPRTVLEAMAIGRPILTTDVPGCRETVCNGVNGWLVKKGSIEELAERMIWFIENPEHWESMAEKSHDLAKDKFDVHKVNADIMKVLELNREEIV
ncbi:glycosyltransferase family 4 protein [Vibrio sp.]|uniref:glycosyltransferase family 4 protein n=1 Tax=Vibrio sp. TaxID=678 RepID=UPI00311EC0D2